MQELVNNLAEGPMHEPVAKGNRGWFRAGDRRINREGRPRGSTAASRHENPSADCAPQADRLMLLIVRGRDLTFRLSKQHASWIINLPPDFEIVGCRVDSARKEIVFTIRSQEFPRIAKGALVPKFVPQFNGLRWMPN
jgi:hypothetical protein